eukprot:COSAG05_NODE_4061_length_1691_cov_3.466709_2_plen_151_part_00
MCSDRAAEKSFFMSQYNTRRCAGGAWRPRPPPIPASYGISSCRAVREPGGHGICAENSTIPPAVDVRSSCRFLARRLCIRWVPIREAKLPHHGISPILRRANSADLSLLSVQYNDTISGKLGAVEEGMFGGTRRRLSPGADVGASGSGTT